MNGFKAERGSVGSYGGNRSARWQQPGLVTEVMGSRAWLGVGVQAEARVLPRLWACAIDGDGAMHSGRKGAGRTRRGVDPLEKGMASHFSIPAWRIPWT